MHLRGQTTTFRTRLEKSRVCRCWPGRHPNCRAGWLLNLDGTQMATTIDAPGPCRLQIAYRPSDHGSVSRPFPKKLQEAILHLRKHHPGWGPNTLLTALKRDGDFRNQPLPSRACMARLLKQAGLTRRYQPHHDLLQPPRMSPNTPHQEWQMDAASASCESREWGRSV
jgi:hypothetical protein